MKCVVVFLLTAAALLTVLAAKTVDRYSVKDYRPLEAVWYDRLVTRCLALGGSDAYAFETTKTFICYGGSGSVKNVLFSVGFADVAIGTQ